MPLKKIKDVYTGNRALVWSVLVHTALITLALILAYNTYKEIGTHLFGKYFLPHSIRGDIKDTFPWAVSGFIILYIVCSIRRGAKNGNLTFREYGIIFILQAVITSLIFFSNGHHAVIILNFSLFYLAVFLLTWNYKRHFITATIQHSVNVITIVLQIFYAMAYELASRLPGFLDFLLRIFYTMAYELASRLLGFLGFLLRIFYTMAYELASRLLGFLGFLFGVFIKCWVSMYKYYSTMTREHQVFSLLAFLGFLFGIAVNPTWQESVGFAQVLAGVVHYPDNNAFYLYVKEAWNGVNQVNAIFLMLGMSEKTLSYCMSGLIGSLVFLALGMISYGATRATLFSILLPPFIIVTNVYNGTTAGAYPIYLGGIKHTHGIIGNAFVFLLVGTLMCRKYLAAGLVIGLMPMVHIALFLLAVPVAGVILLTNRLEKETYRKLIYGVLIGGFVSLISFTFYHFGRVELPDIDSDTARKYLVHFVNTLDAHRGNIRFDQTSARLNCLSIIYAAILLLLERKNLTTGVKYLLKFMVVFGVLGLVFALVSHLPVENQPTLFIKLMPGRILGTNHVLAVIAVVASYRYLQSYRITGIFIFGAICLASFTGAFPAYYVVFGGMIIICTMVIVFKEIGNFRETEKNPPTKLAKVVGILLLIGAGVVVGIGLREFSEAYRQSIFRILGFVKIWLALLICLEGISLLFCENIHKGRMTLVFIFWFALAIVAWWDYYGTRDHVFGWLTYSVMLIMTVRAIYWNKLVFFDKR